FLGLQRAGIGLQGDTRISRNRYFIVDPRVIRRGARQQVRLHIHTVAGLALIDFHFVAVGGGVDDDEIASGWPNGNRAVLIDDRNGRLHADVEAVFLLGLGGGPGGQSDYEHNNAFAGLPTAFHRHFHTETTSGDPRRRVPDIMAENDPKPSHKSWIFVHRRPSAPA